MRVFKKDQKNIYKAQGLIAMYGLFLRHTDSFKFRRKYNADQYYRIARKAVSKNARSKVLGKTRSSYCYNG